MVSSGGPVIQAGKETEQGTAISPPKPSGVVGTSSPGSSGSSGYTAFGSGMSNLATTAPSSGSSKSSGGGIGGDVEHYLADSALASMAKSIFKKVKGGAEDAAGDVGKTAEDVAGDVGKVAGSDAAKGGVEDNPIAALALGGIFGRGGGLPTGSRVKTTVPGGNITSSGINGLLNALNPGQWINGNNERFVKSAWDNIGSKTSAKGNGNITTPPVTGDFDH